MIRLPRRRHNFTDTLPDQSKPVAMLVANPNVYWNIATLAELEKMIGSGAISVLKKLLGQSTKLISTVINEVAGGKTSTIIKNTIAKLDRNPSKRRQHPGEKHAPLKIGKSYGWANFMGPGTKLRLRLRNQDPARTASDRVSMAHDIRYSLSKNVGDIRAADNKMISKLKDIQRRGADSKWNIQLGMKGIQTKKLLENVGILRRDLFLSKNKTQDTKMLMDKLGELEQQGFGKISLPGEALRKTIIRKLKRKGGRRDVGFIEGTGIRGGRRFRKRGRKRGRGIHGGRMGSGLSASEASKVIAKQLVPKLISNIKKLGVRQKVAFGPKLKKELEKKIATKLKSGSGIIAILGILGTIATLIPVGIEIGKVVIPIVGKVFGAVKKKLFGKGLEDILSRDIAKVLRKAQMQKMKGLGGKGLGDFIRSLGKRFAQLFKKVIAGAKIAVKIGAPIIREAIPAGVDILKLIAKLARKRRS